MKILQKIVLSAVLATSMVAFSTATMAAEEKKEEVSAKSILETTVTHIEAAQAALEKGEKTEVLAHIKEARQAQKDVVVGALDLKRQKASGKLVAAGKNVKEGKNAEAKASLEEALAAYKELVELSAKVK